MLFNSFVLFLLPFYYRLQLVVYHNEIPARHWGNQLIAWVLPTLSIVGLFLLKLKGIDIIGECNRVWYRYTSIIT